MTEWTQKHLLGIEPLSVDEITLILDTAVQMREIMERPIKKVSTLRGRTVVNLLVEASTRTRASFEMAERILSADSLSIQAAGSSVSKGESLLDTVKNLEAMTPMSSSSATPRQEPRTSSRAARIRAS